MTKNPCILLGEDRCRFYVEIDNEQPFGHCLIIGRENHIEDVRDRFGTLITDEQLMWFEANCPDFPKLRDLEKIERGETNFRLPGECTFYLEAVEK
jgi:hypothetical protein